MLQIFVVCDNGNKIFHSFQLRGPFFICSNDGYYLLLVHFKVTFCWGVFLSVVGHRSQGVGVVVLGQDASGDVVVGVPHNFDGFVRVEVHDDWGHCETVLEFVEGFLCFWGPFQGKVLSGEFGEGVLYCGKLTNKTPVEVDKPYQALDNFDSAMCVPFWYSLHICLVYAYFIM